MPGNVLRTVNTVFPLILTAGLEGDNPIFANEKTLRHTDFNLHGRLNG